MSFQANPAAIPFFVATAISIALALFAATRRAAPVAIAFALMMAGEAAWALFEALELVVTDLEIKKICFILRATGTVTMTLSLLATVLLYTRRDPWIKPLRFTLICAPSVLLLVLAWTNPWHALYWTRLWNTQISGHWIAMPVYGPFFTLHFVYCYVLVGISIGLLAAAVWRSAGVYRAQAAVMLFGVVLPLFVSVIDMSQIFGFIYVDSAAMSFAVTGVAFVPGLFRYRLLDLTPVAWAMVVEGIDDPVVVIDPMGRVVELNPAALKLVDPHNDSLIGAEPAHVFAHWPHLKARLTRISSDELAPFEVEGPATAPASVYDGRISRLGDPGCLSGWVVVLRDISGHKRAAAERVSTLREQSARAEAEAVSIAKDRFLATLSHELRTPLTPVLATVTAMLAQPDTPESLLPVLEMIRRNIVVEARLIDDLLDLSRIRRGSLLFRQELVDAHQLVHEVINICRDDLQSAQLELVIELEARDHHVDADPIRFQQALWNLIKNSIKFTPAGGRLTVRSRNPDGGIALGATDLVIEVHDTGIGIAPAVLPRIFDVLEQGGISTTRRYGGLGLGLTIGRSILEQHGGRLTASSPGPGLGSTFTLEIPTAVAPARSDDDRARTRPAAGDVVCDRSLRILIVEDDPDTLEYICNLLSSRGHQVDAAANLAAALRIGRQAEFDVIVSDLELPDGSGFDLMCNLRTRNAIPAVALSGFGASTDIEQSRAAGFAIHLTKPVDFRHLEQAIQRAAADTQLVDVASG